MSDQIRYSNTRLGITPDPDGEWMLWRDVVSFTDAMKAGVAVRIAELEGERDRLQEALRNVLVETNFISLQAARSYIKEVLEEGLPLL